MRVVAWNIRAGGGIRAERIARQIHRWNADVVALSEFRATEASCRLAVALRAAGLSFQITTAREGPANALLVASRWPLRRVRLARAPVEAGRWLTTRVDGPLPFLLGAMHVPNRITRRKWPFLASVLTCAQGFRGGPALFVGDTNSGRRGLDEQVPAFNAIEEGWIDGLAGCGWQDAFRFLRPDARAYTWHAPNGGNGFRIDQAFVNAALLARLKDAAYVWGGPRRARRTALSDHAALLIDFADR